MNLYYFGQALNLASLYMIAGLGDAIIIKSGHFNLGGEGQVYAGGFICGILLASMRSVPGVFAVTLAFIAAFGVSALLSFLSALMQRYKNADFLFTSFLVSAAVIPVIDGLISGPCRGKTGNLLATEMIDEKFQFISIMSPSDMNLTFVAAIGLCVFGFWFLYKTTFGRQLCIYGTSVKFGKYCGYDGRKIDFVSAVVSGGLHGVCGACAVCGTYFACHGGFYAGMGWNGLCASLIAGSNPLLVIPGGIVMGFAKTYADNFAIYHNIGYDISSFIQAVVLFCFAIPFIRGKKQ